MKHSTICCVVGARPNFVKIAPLMHALRSFSEIKTELVHTGQHYDHSLSASFFRELNIPEPDRHLNVGSGSHGKQTALIIERFEQVCFQQRYDWIVVVGDVNSTMACALVGAKLKIPVAHVEAGLRSFDRTMPEEINRIVTDAICDCHFVSEPSGVENLKIEGVPEYKIHLVGNIMIDTLVKQLNQIKPEMTLQTFNLEPRSYGLVTLHRPSNVDHPDTLRNLLLTLNNISRQIPVMFPVHPRTRITIDQLIDSGELTLNASFAMTEPLTYNHFLALMANARIVFTDSGGMQEETTYLNVPCLTFRENTERPITVQKGTSTLVGSNPDTILSVFNTIMNGQYKTSEPIDLWDGCTGRRIAKILAEKCRSESF
ncbi:UDP-N-acetylglucosamine 2-epimerase (non-hydrolyzing) [bacterium]|nr:UDP-N-acetylglucosamine 2-epimerase (non-hydrolyzing) [candidate division CSSED10-310 bacterium]